MVMLLEGRYYGMSERSKRGTIVMTIKTIAMTIKTIVMTRGVNVGGCGGWFTPQRNDPVGLKLSAVGLKIMRLFTRGALRSKLNI